MSALVWLLGVAIAFAVGSVPFGYLVGRLFYRTDIRAQGSGNIGAMNALRTLGKRGAAIVLVLDAIKGFVPVYFAARWSHNEPITAAVAIAAVLGHCFSPWLGWKGGKGVATSFGAIFGLSWKAGLVAVGGWVIGALATQYSSVGSMLGNLTAPLPCGFSASRGPIRSTALLRPSSSFIRTGRIWRVCAPGPKAAFASHACDRMPKAASKGRPFVADQVRDEHIP